MSSVRDIPTGIGKKEASEGTRIETVDAGGWDSAIYGYPKATQLAKAVSAGLITEEQEQEVEPHAYYTWTRREAFAQEWKQFTPTSQDPAKDMEHGVTCNFELKFNGMDIMDRLTLSMHRAALSATKAVKNPQRIPRWNKRAMIGREQEILAAESKKREEDRHRDEEEDEEDDDDMEFGDDLTRARRSKRSSRRSKTLRRGADELFGGVRRELEAEQEFDTMKTDKSSTRRVPTSERKYTGWYVELWPFHILADITEKGGDDNVWSRRHGLQVLDDAEKLLNMSKKMALVEMCEGFGGTSRTRTPEAIKEYMIERSAEPFTAYVPLESWFDKTGGVKCTNTSWGMPTWSISLRPIADILCRNNKGTMLTEKGGNPLTSSSIELSMILRFTMLTPMARRRLYLRQPHWELALLSHFEMTNKKTTEVDFVHLHPAAWLSIAIIREVADKDNAILNTQGPFGLPAITSATIKHLAFVRQQQMPGEFYRRLVDFDCFPSVGNQIAPEFDTYTWSYTKDGAAKSPYGSFSMLRIPHVRWEIRVNDFLAKEEWFVIKMYKFWMLMCYDEDVCITQFGLSNK